MNELLEEIAKALSSQKQPHEASSSPIVNLFTNLGNDASEHDMADMCRGIGEKCPLGGLFKGIEQELNRQSASKDKEAPTMKGKPASEQCKKPVMMFSMAPPGGQGVKSAPAAVSERIPVDIREMESYIAVYLEIPGVRKESISLDVEHSDKEDVLSVVVDKEPYAISSDKFLLKERVTGTLRRTIKLPKHVDVDKIHAKYEDGVLVVKFNKLRECADRRKIVVE